MDRIFELFFGGPKRVAAFVLVVIAIALYAAYLEQKQWDAFAAAHECKLVEVIPASLMSTVSVDPSTGGTQIGTVSVPEKKAYKCNDGVTYWR